MALFFRQWLPDLWEFGLEVVGERSQVCLFCELKPRHEAVLQNRFRAREDWGNSSVSELECMVIVLVRV